MAQNVADRDIRYFDTRIKLKDVNGARQIKPGTAVMIGSNGRTAEIARVDGIDTVNGYVTIARGCMDTPPKQHVRGTALWFVDGYTGTDGREYDGSEQVAVKVLPRTSSKVLKMSESAIGNVQMDHRLIRPYLPGRFQVNGTPWWAGTAIGKEDGGTTFTWAHRDRVTQRDRLIDHFEMDTGPEPGTTYSLQFAVGAGSPFELVNGIAGNSWYRSMDDWQQILTGVTEPDVQLTFVLTAWRDGWDSWMTYYGSCVLKLEAMQVKQLARMVAHTVRVLDDGTLEPPTVPPKDPSLSALFFPYEWPYQDALMTGRTGQTATLGSTAYRAELPTNSFQISASTGTPEPHGPSWPYSPRGIVVAYPPIYITNAEGKKVLVGGQIGVTTTQFALTEVDKPGAFRAGMLMVLTNNDDARKCEVIQIETYNAADRTFTAKRGCLDTIPHAWGMVNGWLYRNTDAYHDSLAYNAGDALMATIYAADMPSLNPPPKLVRMASRKQRPYPPGNVLLAGKQWTTPARIDNGGAVSLTWAHRDRITQGNEVVGHLAINFNLERNAAHYLLVKSGDTILREFRGMTGTSFTYDYLSAWADARRIEAARAAEAGEVPDFTKDQAVTFELGTERDGLESWQTYLMSVNIGMPPDPDNPNPGPLVSMPHFFYELPYLEALKRNLTSVSAKVGWLGVAGNHEQATDYLVVKTVDSSKTQVGAGNDVRTGTMTGIPYNQTVGGVVQTITPMIEPGDTNVAVKNITTQPGDLLYVATSGEIIQVVGPAPGGIEIKRGCYDTIPTRFNYGAVWAFADSVGSDSFAEHRRDDVINIGVVPMIPGKQLGPANAYTEDFTFKYRYLRPYPPGLVKVSGKPWHQLYIQATDPEATALITWVGRNRITQGTDIVDHYTPHIAAEPGTTYRIRVGVQAGASFFTLRTVSGIEALYFRYTPDMMRFDGRRAAELKYSFATQEYNKQIKQGNLWWPKPVFDGNEPQAVTVYLESIRDEAESWMKYAMEFMVLQPKPDTPPDTGSGNDDQGSNQPGTNPPDPPDSPDIPDPDNPYNPNPGGTAPPDEENPNSPNNPQPDEPTPRGWGLNWSRNWDMGQTWPF